MYSNQPRTPRAEYYSTPETMSPLFPSSDRNSSRSTVGSRVPRLSSSSTPETNGERSSNSPRHGMVSGTLPTEVGWNSFKGSVEVKRISDASYASDSRRVQLSKHRVLETLKDNGVKKSENVDNKLKSGSKSSKIKDKIHYRI
jgi:hypothetical protein